MGRPPAIAAHILRALARGLRRDVFLQSLVAMRFFDAPDDRTRPRDRIRGNNGKGA
jgi:hypothetical protein